MAKKLTIDEVKEKYASNLMEIDGVEGIGIGEEKNRPVIKVYVSKDPRALKNAIPDEIEGYPVRLEYSGEFNALE